MKSSIKFNYVTLLMFAEAGHILFFYLHTCSLDPADAFSSPLLFERMKIKDLTYVISFVADKGCCSAISPVWPIFCTRCLRSDLRPFYMTCSYCCMYVDSLVTQHFMTEHRATQCCCVEELQLMQAYLFSRICKQ